MTESTLTTSAPPVERRAPRGTRLEIQVLRAFAVTAVVVNHFWPNRLGGGFLGVDIFFVISGFLITSHLLREQDSTGRIRFGAFWLRRARRLLPASLLVAAVAAIGVFLLIPQTSWVNDFRNIGASVLYVENWVLAADSVDYFAADNVPSPVMHYWSLSVEEQFYLVWPALIALGALLATRLGLGRGRRPLVVLLGVVVVTSLIASIALTWAVPAPAYFNTTARAWEFGAGGLLAVLEHRVRWGRRSRVVAAVVGWLVLVASVIFFDGSMPFPGVLAAVPVLAAVLVISAGDVLNPRGQFGTAAVRPLEWVGAASYSIYLWHWPLLIFAFAIPWIGSGWQGRVVLLVATLVLAGLTRRFVEDPVRRSTYLIEGPPRRHLWLLGATVLVVLACVIGTLTIQAAVAHADADAAVAATEPCAAARAMAPGNACRQPHQLVSTAAALAASEDLHGGVTSGELCDADRDDSTVHTCSFGVPAADATRTIALVGDSHARHWIGAIERVALERSWRVVEYTKSSCAGVSDPTVSASWYPAGADSCHRWSQEMIDTVANDPTIDTVFVSSISRDYLQSDGHEGVTMVTPAAYRDTWQRWLDAGKQVVVLADTPVWGLGSVPECVLREGVDDPCAVPASARDGDPMVAAVTQSPDDALTLVDLNDFFCDAELCHPAIGGLVVIGDGNHMTLSYSRSLAPYLAESLRDLP